MTAGSNVLGFLSAFFYKFCDHGSKCLKIFSGETCVLLLNMLTLVHTGAYHMEKISRRLLYIYRNWYYLGVELSG